MSPSKIPLIDLLIRVDLGALRGRGPVARGRVERRSPGLQPGRLVPWCLALGMEAETHREEAEKIGRASCRERV